MATQAWQPGRFYNPGALVRPLTAPPTVQSAPDNPDFEDGNTGWTLDTGFTIGEFGAAFTGTFSLEYDPGDATLRVVLNDNVVPASPGLVVNAQCKVQQGSSSSGQAGGGLVLRWYDSMMVQLQEDGSFDDGAGDVEVDSGSGGEWRTASVRGIGPPGAAFLQLGLYAFLLGGGSPVYLDTVSWDYTYAGPPDGLIFKAVQADAGFSGNTEPVWPVVLGNTVVDNEVTWEAVLTSRVVWQAFPILKSGAVEPTFPLTAGATVADNIIVWEAVSGQITDSRCPQTRSVLIAARKVFAVDNDIISFSATVNPLDWSTPNDAGYLPFGLQKFGTSPVAALDLYRSNLVAFNANGFQMWQIDEDPANNAFLDALPISSEFHRASQPLANDLVFLNPTGVRDLGIAAASTNLQSGGVGEPVDPLIKAEIKAAKLGGYDPIALYWPKMGQHWTMFQNRAYVLTINEGRKRSWSRYLFPAAITDWTLLGSDLYLRAGDLVWKMDEDLVADDVVQAEFESFVMSAESFVSRVGFRASASYNPPGSPPDVFGSTDPDPPVVNDRDIVGFTYEDGIRYRLAFDETDPVDFHRIEFVGDDQTTVVLLQEDASTAATAANRLYEWFVASNISAGNDYTVRVFLTEAADADVPFQGIIQWPHLDMGTGAREKQMVGLDLVADAPEGVLVSVGYNEKDLAQRTADYLVPADTLPGPNMVPFPVSGPTFDLRLTFPAGQEWEWEAATLYVQDWRRTS